MNWILLDSDPFIVTSVFQLVKNGSLPFAYSSMQNFCYFWNRHYFQKLGESFDF